MTAGVSTIKKKTRGPALPLRIFPSPPPVNVAPVSQSSRYPAGSRSISAPATAVNKKTEGPTLPPGIYPPPPLVNVSPVSRFVALPSRFNNYIRLEMAAHELSPVGKQE